MKRLILTAGSMCAMLAIASGGEIYEKHCAKCHGADGKGQTVMGKKLQCKDYSVKATWEKLTDAQATKSVADGMKDGDKTLMKPFSPTLSEADIKTSLTEMKALAK
jgi:cytochrome c6